MGDRDEQGYIRGAHRTIRPVLRFLIVKDTVSYWMNLSSQRTVMHSSQNQSAINLKSDIFDNLASWNNEKSCQHRTSVLRQNTPWSKCYICQINPFSRQNKDSTRLWLITNTQPRTLITFFCTGDMIWQFRRITNPNPLTFFGLFGSGRRRQQLCSLNGIQRDTRDSPANTC